MEALAEPIDMEDWKAHARRLARDPGIDVHEAALEVADSIPASRRRDVLVFLLQEWMRATCLTASRSSVFAGRHKTDGSERIINAAMVRVYPPSAGDREGKLLGDCTAEDLAELAHFHEQLAKSNEHRAGCYRKLADELTARRRKFVRNLPAAVVAEIMR